jgi:hypothetical protein
LPLAEVSSELDNLPSNSGQQDSTSGAAELADPATSEQQSLVNLHTNTHLPPNLQTRPVAWDGDFEYLI